MKIEATNQLREGKPDKIIYFKQTTWYFMAFGLYLFCCLLGFAVAYFLLKLVISMQIK